MDDDCDGAIDEMVAEDVYVDADGDGFGTGAPVRMCLEAGYALRAGDCDDTNAAIFPDVIRCAEASSYQRCGKDGQWTKAALCGGQRSCIAQPNGLGICI